MTEPLLEPVGTNAVLRLIRGKGVAEGMTGHFFLMPAALT
jgi:hypothetical protein